MSTMFMVGIAIAAIGGIWLLVLAFRESFIWGIGFIIVPFVSLIFVALHWGKAWKPFLINVVGGALIFAGFTSNLPSAYEIEMLNRAQEEVTKQLESGAITAQEAQQEQMKIMQALAGGEKYQSNFGKKDSAPERSLGYTLRSAEPEPETLTDSEKKAIQKEKIQQAIKNESKYKQLVKASGRKKGFIIIHEDDAEKYIGEEIKVTMKKGQIRNGVLIDTGKNTLLVEKRTRSGKYSFNLETKRIKKIEVKTWLD